MNSQLDGALNISSNVNAVQDIPSQASTTTTPLTTPFNLNENQLLQDLCPNLNIQAMTPNHSLQPMEGYQVPHSSSSAHPQEVIAMSEYSFFYTPRNDFQMYHIICKEIPLSFELVSQLINNIDNNSIQYNNIYMFYHEQPEIKKIYQVTCEMISHTFMFQFLNKIIHGIQYTQSEYQCQEFSKTHQENLKFHLKNDLLQFLAPKQVYEPNYNFYRIFIQDYCAYENGTNSNTDTSSHFQQYDANALLFNQSFTPQQDNSRQLVDIQNSGDNFNLPY